MKTNILTTLFVLFLSVISFLGGSVSAAEKNTRILEDCSGRKVKVPADVKRIVCLFSFSGHAAVMMGKGENIVAVDKPSGLVVHSDGKTRPTSPETKVDGGRAEEKTLVDWFQKFMGVLILKKNLLKIL